jgi:hypothetical protein
MSPSEQPETPTVLRRGLQKLLVRGESVVASTGLLLVAIFVSVVGLSTWWTSDIHRVVIRDARAGEIEAAGRILVSSIPALVDSGELGLVRVLLVEAGRQCDLSSCTLRMPDGDVLVYRNAGLSGLSGPDDPTADDIVTRSYNVELTGGGTARLGITAPVTSARWIDWASHAGLGLISVGGLFALLVVYRRMRRRIGALGVIRDALLTTTAGETSAAELVVDESLGPEAQAWNALVAENRQLKEKDLQRRVGETRAGRRDRRSDFFSACDAMWQGIVLVDSADGPGDARRDAVRRADG